MKLLRFIKYRGQFIVGFIAKTIEVILELMLPIFMAILMKEGLNSGGDINKAYLMVALIIGFAIMGYLSTIYSHKLVAKVSQDFAKNLRQAIFYQVEDLSLVDINDFSSSSLLNRLNLDVSHLQNGLAMTMRIASRAPVLMIGSIISLFIVNKKLALILTIGIPIVVAVLIVIMYASMRIFQKFQLQNDKLLENVRDNVEGARMIRAFAQVEHEENRFKKRNEALSKIMVKLGRITSLSSPLTTLGFNIILIVMIYFGAIEINKFNTSMSQEQLIQVINYTTQLTLSVIGVMNLILLYTKVYSSAIRINEILDKENSVKNEGTITLDSNPAKIEFKNVSFAYGNNSGNILKNINVTINPGETIGVVGLTGSGKTTFVDLIMRFFDATEGEVLINDINIKQYDLVSLRNNIAYASQKAALLQGNVRDNINMNNIYTEEQINKALKEAQASFILKRDEKLDSKVLRQGVNYSGGQKQRLALSRALVKQSSILILDDVFSALDYMTDYKIRQELIKRENKQTKIFISQRLSSLFDTDKIIVFDKGKVIDVGTHEQLLKRNNLYQKIYNTQVSGGEA